MQTECWKYTTWVFHIDLRVRWEQVKGGIRLPIFLSSMELSNCWPATMRRTARLIPEYRVGCSSKPFLYLTGGRGNTDEYTQGNNKMWIRCIYFCVFSPLNGVVPVFSVFAVRVEKNVLVDSSTEAEHVWCRMFAGLQHLQHHSESLLPVSRSIPPARTFTCTWRKTFSWDWEVHLYYFHRN